MDRARLHLLPWFFAMLIVIVYVFIVLWALLSGVVQADRVTVTATGGPPALVALPPELARVLVDTDGYVGAVSADAPLGLIIALTKLLWGVAGAFLLVQMYRLTRTIAEGDPFAPANSKRLTRAGWVVIAVEAVSISATLAVDFYVRSLSHSRLWHLSTDSERDPYLMIAGFLLVALGRAFKTGRRLQRAANLTI